MLWRAGDAGVAERVACDRCGARFAPELTRGACPLCGMAAGSWTGQRWRGFGDLDSDDRVVAIVVAATLANLVLLALLAVAVLRLGT